MLHFYLILAWRNLWRNKRRTFITMFAIFFSIFFALMMRSMQLGSYGSMIENTVGRYTGHIQVHKNGYWDSRSFEDLFFDEDESILKKIQANTEISLVAPRLESFMLAAGDHKSRATLVVGFNPEIDKHLSNVPKFISEGRYFNASDSNAVVISNGLAEYLNLHPGDTLIALGQGYHGISSNAAFPIIGIAKLSSPELNRASVFLPIQTAQYLFGAENGLTSYSILVDNPSKFKEIAHKLTNELQNPDLEIMDWQVLMPELIQAIEVDSSSGQIMLFVLYLVVGFGIFGTVLMMISERKFELGVMLALGTGRKYIGTLLCVELFILTLLGSVIALGFTYPILWYLYLNPIPLTGEMAEMMLNYGMEPIIPFAASFEVMYSPISVIYILIGLISFYPIRYAFRLNPIEAMK
ncbi:ABC transporter permease [bacterium]|nr:MAG: ABC transporter permease [bacterium]